MSPALTEMLFYACKESFIIARTQACNYPEAVFNLPVVSTYPFDTEKIIALNADIVFSETGITSADQIKTLEENGISIYMFDPQSMSDIFSSMRRISKFCNCDTLFERKIVALENRMNDIKPLRSNGKNALGIIWTDPIYVYGLNTLFNDQLSKIGLENALDSVFKNPYPEISREYMLRVNPDYIFGSSFDKLDTTLFKNFPELKRIKAYKNKDIFEINADILTRPGPRAVEAIELMKNAIEND